ncbi:MAG TPA: hypothetical protein VJY41_05615 [Prolixibacteraceae bacterium]|nr:hypothetical protein [Prolixibacteraceae bacterium]
MNRIAPLLLILVLFAGCKNKLIFDKNLAHESMGFINQAKELCDNDNAKLWGFSLHAPILLAETNSNTVFASQNPDSLYKYKELFVGHSNINLLVDNGIIDWHKQKWVLLSLPLPTDDFERRELMATELFRFHESKIGLNKLQTPKCAHLDDPTNRLWMKIEAEALKSALTTFDNSVQKEHIRMALAARNMRKVNTGQMFVRENLHDLKLGIPQLTGLLLSGRSDEQDTEYLYQQLETFQQSENFLNSFSSIFLPTYGLLMSKNGNEWLKDINSETNLMSFILDFYDFKYHEDFLDLLVLLKSRYNGEKFEKEEVIVKIEKQKELDKYHIKFFESPCVFITIDASTNYQFKPEKEIHFENRGSVYFDFVASGNWGSISISDGALLAANKGYFYFSLPIKTEGQKVWGSDWEMTLNEGYSIVQYKNSDKFTVQKNKNK